MFDGLSDDRGRDEPHHRGNFSSNVGSVNSSSGSLTKIDLFSLYVLFCLFRPRYVHQGICLLSYHKLCIQYVHMKSFEKKQFSGVPSHGLKWENKTYKLKSLLKIV